MDWHSTALNPERAPAGSGVYRFLRWLIRLWLTLFFRTIRLLNAEAMPDLSGAILAVNHAAGFFEALILVATFEREVRCLLARERVPGLAHGLLARGLRMILYDAEGDGWRPVLQACSEALARRSSIAIFAEPEARSGEPSRFALTAAAIALEAESRQSEYQPSGGGLSVWPVDLFLPVEPSKSAEVLVYVDQPLLADEYLTRDGEMPREHALALAIDSARLRNPFRLQPAEFARFLSDLEEILRRDLARDWASRPNWKQTLEGFELSRSVKDSADLLNSLGPGRLVALRESLDRYREAQRALALRRLQIDFGAPWLKSPWRRIVAWVESVAGLPVAAYGLLNLAGVGLILVATGGLATVGLPTGRLKKQSARSWKSEWGARAAVALVCYVAQTWACAYFLGRAAAGYYAVSLPLSAAFLARYWWLLRHRTRLVILAASLPAQSAKLAGPQKQLLSGIDAARGALIEAPVAPPEQAVGEAAQ